jgi:4-hydroxybenzoate polyprenyltransferase
MSRAATVPYSPTRLGFYRAFWTTMRPYLLFVSGASGLVGLALPAPLCWSRFVPALLACFFAYGLGQALTDVTQTDTDALSAPYRPLVRGLLTRRSVAAFSLAGLALCTLVVVALQTANLALCIVSVLGLATYTPLKRRWWGGPLWNSWIVGLLPAIGFLCVSPTAAIAEGAPRLVLGMGSVFFTYAVFVLLGYFKDISADRRTGYRTLPVAFGWTVSVAASAVLWLLGLACSAALIHAHAGPRQGPVEIGSLLACAYWAAGAVLLGKAHLTMLATRREAEAHRSIGEVVRGYVLLHVGEAVWFQPVLAWPGLVYLVAFELALALRPERTQI